MSTCSESPRASARGITTLQAKRGLATVFFALHLNVLLHNGFRDAHGRDKVPDRPNCLTIPISFREERESSLHLTGGIGLEYPYCVCDRELGGDGTQDVDMVFIGIRLNDMNFGVLPFQSFHKIAEVTAHTALEEFATEFGRKHHMVSCVVYGVGLSTIHGHTLSLTENSGSPPSAGSRPQFSWGNKSRASKFSPAYDHS